MPGLSELSYIEYMKCVTSIHELGGRIHGLHRIYMGTTLYCVNRVIIKGGMQGRSTNAVMIRSLKTGTSMTGGLRDLVAKCCLSVVS